MVLESTMICLDNSEWMRNGDFVPTRLQSQHEAASFLLGTKLRANPENAVGLLAMSSAVEVLSTMTPENNRLLNKLHQLQPHGKCNFLASIKVAHLALKHRQNRNHAMRVVLFIGSPIEDVDNTELQKLAKKFKKEKVNCDVVCIGEAESDNSQIMGQFIDTLNGKDGTASNLIVVPSGTSLLEALKTSAICRGENGAVAGNGPAGGFEFGVDPEDDPDLALALRVSMEEERARQAAQTAASGAAPAPDNVVTPAVGGGAEPIPDVMDVDMGVMSEEQQLEWALRMSMHQDDNVATGTPNVPLANPAIAPPERMDVQDREENFDDLMNDPELLQQIINELPGEDAKKKDKTEKK